MVKKFIGKRRRKRRFRKGRRKFGERLTVRWRIIEKNMSLKMVKNGWKNYEGKKSHEIKIDY